MQRALLLILLLPLLYTGCTKDEAPKPPDDCTVCSTTVSFKTDIMPIMNNNCATSGCHDFDNASGGLVLDSANAYNQLSASGSGYVDTNDVFNSLFYLTLLPGSDQPMPQDQPPLPQCDINRIKCWIEQGAPDN